MMTINEIKDNLFKTGAFVPDTVATYGLTHPTVKLKEGFVLLTTANTSLEITLKRMTRNSIKMNGQTFYIYKQPNPDNTEAWEIYNQLSNYNIEFFKSITLTGEITFTFSKRKLNCKKHDNLSKTNQLKYMHEMVREHNLFIYNPKLYKSSNASFILLNFFSKSNEPFFKVLFDKFTDGIYPFHIMYPLILFGHFISATKLQLNRYTEDASTRSVLIPLKFFKRILKKRNDKKLYNFPEIVQMQSIKYNSKLYMCLTFSKEFLNAFTSKNGYIQLPLKFVAEATKNSNLSKNGIVFMLLVIDYFMHSPNPMMKFKVRNLLNKAGITIHEGIQNATNRLNKYLDYLYRCNLLITPFEQLTASDIDKVIEIHLTNPLRDNLQNSMSS